tara:strand:+ start:827 stop:2377 length:1551 start_codon:yes stop_codon:yes gene_type:complete
MAIKRYTANADTTITNALKTNLTTRGTGSNMGAADVLEVFSIYGQASGSTGLSQELSRILVKFPVDDISDDRTAGTIPASGSVRFYLRMFNAEHGETIPRTFSLTAAAVTKNWEEGTGLDMVEYSDETFDGAGANWTNYSANNSWSTPGGDYSTDSPSVFHKDFSTGIEDLEVDITTLVEQWVNSAGNVLGSKSNYGVGIRLTGSQEAYYSRDSSGGILQNLTGATQSYYTKKFFARGSEFFFKRPVIEARWNSARKDDRGNFYYSSSLAPALENLNTIYLYNYIRGRLRNIPSVGTGDILVSIYSGSSDDTFPSGSKIQLPLSTYVTTDLHTNVTGGWVSTGIYSASFALTSAATPVKTFYDVWHTGGVEFKTGSFSIENFHNYEIAPSDKYVVNISNLRPKYSRKETARFRLYTRKKDWCPTIYTKARKSPENEIIPSSSFKILRLVDNYEVVAYGTGSDLHTQLSYDLSGNYFDFDMSMLQEDFSYGIKLTFYNDSIGTWVEQPYIFKFRVEE